MIECMAAMLKQSPLQGGSTGWSGCLRHEGQSRSPGGREICCRDSAAAALAGVRAKANAFWHKRPSLQLLLESGNARGKPAMFGLVTDILQLDKPGYISIDLGHGRLDAMIRVCSRG